MIYGFKIRLLVKKRTYSMHYRWSYCENSRFQSSWHCLRNFSHIMDHLAMCCPPFKLPRCYCHFDFAFWHIVCWKDIYLIAPCLEADITGSTERKSDKNWLARLKTGLRYKRFSFPFGKKYKHIKCDNGADRKLKLCWNFRCEFVCGFYRRSDIKRCLKMRSSCFSYAHVWKEGKWFQFHVKYSISCHLPTSDVEWPANSYFQINSKALPTSICLPGVLFLSGK